MALGPVTEKGGGQKNSLAEKRGVGCLEGRAFKRSAQDPTVTSPEAGHVGRVV